MNPEFIDQAIADIFGTISFNRCSEGRTCWTCFY